jgi:pimeloyl-ACP methyl ester carboxylesterase
MKRNVLLLVMLGCFSLLCMTSCRCFQKKPFEIYKSDKMVDIGTHKLRVVLADIPSDYTIILEAGGGMYSDAYKGIQDTLVRLTGMRVMSYDRSGFGGSELGPDDFSAIDEVDVLKKCLEVLGFKSNYILVGHSYGGFLVQLFAARYPELVSGLVLIDPMNVKFVDRFGLDNLNAITPYFENPTTDYEKAGNRMIDFFPVALDTMRSKELPEQTPVALITAGKFPIANVLWRTCHEDTVMNSEKHKLILAEENSHDIISENPELVVNTILELVMHLKTK